MGAFESIAVPRSSGKFHQVVYAVRALVSHIPRSQESLSLARQVTSQAWEPQLAPRSIELIACHLNELPLTGKESPIRSASFIALYRGLYWSPLGV